MTNLERILKENKVVVAKTEGDSMYPMLVEGRDNVMIAPPIFPLKKYDVPVYRRDGHYTMHRIVKVTKRGYIICGDNRAYLERDIKDCDIVGVLIAFYHDGKLVNCTDKDYMKYAKKVCRNLPVRIIRRLIKRIFKRA